MYFNNCLLHSYLMDICLGHSLNRKITYLLNHCFFKVVHQEGILDYTDVSSVNVKYREEDIVHGLFVVRSVTPVDGCSTREGHQTDN